MENGIQESKEFIDDLYIIKSTVLFSDRTKFIDRILYEPSSVKSQAAGIILRKELKDIEFKEMIKLVSLQPHIVRNIIKNFDPVTS